MAQTRDAKLADLKPDKRNANKGTQRGAIQLEESLRAFGAGRSILIDKHGAIIAGNKTVEQAGQMGLDNVIVVETDGTQIVAVQRTDLDLDTDPKARQLAYADNRVAEVGLEWDAELIASDINAGIDLSGMWKDEELDKLISGDLPAAGDAEINEGASGQYAVMITCDSEREQTELLERFIAEGMECRALML